MITKHHHCGREPVKYTGFCPECDDTTEPSAGRSSRVCDLFWIVSKHGTQCPHCGAKPGEYHRERKAEDICVRCGERRDRHAGSEEMRWGSFPYSGKCDDGSTFTMTEEAEEAMSKANKKRTRYSNFLTFHGALLAIMSAVAYDVGFRVGGLVLALVAVVVIVRYGFFSPYDVEKP